MSNLLPAPPSPIIRAAEGGWGGEGRLGVQLFSLS